MWKSDHGQNVLFSMKLVRGFGSRNWLLAGHLLTPEPPLGEPGRQGRRSYERFVMAEIAGELSRPLFKGKDIESLANWNSCRISGIVF